MDVAPLTKIHLRQLALLAAASLLWACGSGTNPQLATGEHASEPNPLRQASTVGEHAPIVGFADLHFHMMAEHAFGGGWMHGKHDGPHALDDCDGGFPPSDHARLQQDLAKLTATCPASIAVQALTAGLPWVVAGTGGGIFGSELVGKAEGTEGDTGLHLQRKNFGEGWPRWDTLAHQQGWQGWLRSAHERGLQVVVMSAVSFGWLCSLIPESNRRDCDEMTDVMLQLDAAHQLARNHRDWLEIALNPQHAREIVAQGKLAMVLAVETSHLMGRDVNDSNLIERLDRLYNAGVRSLQPVHQADNAFAGAALHNKIFQFAQYTENCLVDTDCGLTLGFDVDATCKNVRGLTPLGQRLIKEMMNRGMLIDLAHLSERAIEAAFDLSAVNKFYPLYFSHGHFREIMTASVADTEKSTPARFIYRLRQTGGMFGLRTAHEATHTFNRSRVPNDCHGSSRSFAQAYEYGDLGLQVPIAFGADLNGFIQQTRPRFGEQACSATFKAEADCQAAQQKTTAGVGTEFDTKGLAHEGLLPDLITDLKNSNVDTSNLERSAESFLAMWERAQSDRARTPLPVANFATGEITHLASASDRESGYPSMCGTTYCPAAQSIGGQCRYDVECESGQCSAVQCAGIGTPGRCVCQHDSSCAQDRYCAGKVPGIPGDNGCELRREEHAFCDRDRQCASGACGGFVGGTGWCYSPSSKAVGQGCRVNAECTTGSCGDFAQVCKCTRNSHCAAEQYCGFGANDGECRQKKGRWSPCVGNDECRSNKCRGVCW
jgi:microsomal dipeptidase-like Zn-dependent dipeptidase